MGIERGGGQRRAWVVGDPLGPDLLAGQRVERIGTPEDVAEERHRPLAPGQHDPGAHLARSLETPADAAAGEVERLDQPVFAPDEHRAHPDRWLRTRLGRVGKGVGPFELEPRQIGRSHPRQRSRDEARAVRPPARGDDRPGTVEPRRVAGAARRLADLGQSARDRHPGQVFGDLELLARGQPRSLCRHHPAGQRAHDRRRGEQFEPLAVRRLGQPAIVARGTIGGVERRAGQRLAVADEVGASGKGIGRRKCLAPPGTRAGLGERCSAPRQRGEREDGGNRPKPERLPRHHFRTSLRIRPRRWSAD